MISWYNKAKIRDQKDLKREETKMTKTFWSVKYYVMGSGLSIKWFDSKEKAYEFADRDYADAPIRHTFKNPERIKEAETDVALSQLPY